MAGRAMHRDPMSFDVSVDANRCRRKAVAGADELDEFMADHGHGPSFRRFGGGPFSWLKNP